MSSHAVLFIGLIAPLAAIHLTIAWREHPPQTVGFDAPTIRALTSVFAWLVFGLSLIFGVTLFGAIRPLAISFVVWIIFTLIRRRLSLAPLYRASLPLALLGFACVILLFQGVFGDSNFGLFSVFPPDG